MKKSYVPALALVLGMALPASAPADSTTGVCPDGSFFIVGDLEDVPCARAKLVDPADLPPIRPQLLPRPYTWHVDQQARDPNNPYNLLDAAEKIREARSARTGPVPAPAEQKSATKRSGPRVEPRLPGGSVPQFSEAELRDLIRLIEKRQQIASAELGIEDLRGGERLRILLAHSRSFETIVLDWFDLSSEDQRVIAFVVVAPGEQTDFHPNFFVVQGARTFRPDPADPRELGLLVGTPGPIPGGSLALGYLVIPASFDPATSMDLWWNDRSTTATLAP